MSSVQAFYRNPNVGESSEGFTHVIIVGVERVGGEDAEAVTESRLREAFVPEAPQLAQFVSKGLSRASVRALLDFWLGLVADELEGNGRTHLKIGSIWVALSDVAQKPLRSADTDNSFVGVEIDAENVRRIEARDALLPSLVRAGDRVFADIRTRASLADLRELFDAAVKDDKEENTVALHWVGHGLSDSKGAWARDCLVYGDADLGRPRLVLRDSLLIGLEKKFAAGQFYVFVDACRASAGDGPGSLDDGPPPFKGLESKASYHPDRADFDGRTAALMSAAKGQRSFGMPFEPTCFTNALIDALNHFGAKDPFSGEKAVGDPHALERAVSKHVFLQLMGMPIDRSMPDRIRRALEDPSGRKEPQSAIVEHDGESYRPLLDVEEARSLLLLVHEKEACPCAELSPIEAELWDDVPPSRRSATRPVSYVPAAVSDGRWRSYCRFGAKVRATLVHPRRRGQDHPFDVRTGYQRLPVTF